MRLRIQTKSWWIMSIWGWMQIRGAAVWRAWSTQTCCHKILLFWCSPILREKYLHLFATNHKSRKLRNLKNSLRFLQRIKFYERKVLHLPGSFIRDRANILDRSQPWKHIIQLLFCYIHNNIPPHHQASIWLWIQHIVLVIGKQLYRATERSYNI